MKFLTLFLVLFSVKVSALPVLRESAGDFTLGLVTLYPDHRDPHLFYFLPNEISFATDKSTGLPSFSLQTYGIESFDLSNAFGYMSFVFQPGISDEIKGELEAFLSKNPLARLVPLTVGQSYLAIGNNRNGIPSDAASMIFKGWDLPPFGGLLESEMGGNAYLTGAGARMLEDSIRSPVSIVLNACFVVDGLSPMMDADISINYHEVFLQWQAKAKLGWKTVGAQLGGEINHLVQNGTITIKLQGDTQFDDVVTELAHELAAKYLVPSLGNPGDPNGGTDPKVFRSINFEFGNVRVEEQNIVFITIKKQADVHDVRCIAAPFRGLTPFADRLIQNTPMTGGGL